MNPFVEAYRLAANLNNHHGHHWWRVNGPTLHDITAKLVASVGQAVSLASLPPEAVEHVIDFVAGTLHKWDNQFGWDAPHMDEVTEDTFYTWLVRFYVQLERE